jgi:hypothetical protein
MMDAKQRELEHQKAERQLDQSTARLRLLEARAKQRNAEGAIAEISGLQALGDRVRQQLRTWKEADEASFDELRTTVQRGADALSRGADAAGERFDRLDEATDRWFDAEGDQVGAAFQIFDAWLGEQDVEDEEAAEQMRSDLRSAWDEAGKKREALKKAAPEKKDEARRELEASLNRVKDKLKDVGARFKRKSKAGKPAEQRT